MNPESTARLIDDQLSHVWMVRTFLKHSEEAEDDEELCEVFRELYDVMHALGPALERRDWEQYLKLARKKIGRLIAACDQYHKIQPEISSHTNFQMAGRSLRVAVDQIAAALRGE
jgi:hypothetical protein